MSKIDTIRGPRLSAETLHASTVAKDGRAVLITGPSGSGKSDLTLRLLDRGFTLVSDDRTIVRKEGERLLASAPPTIAGKLEVRGIGIVEVERVDNVPVGLLVELTSDIQRLPDDSPERPVLGVKLPLINIDAMTASAPSKVALALDRMGLKFQ
ncbi:MAG: HPr kinase/phosphorylase [Sphingomicrobium sp.]